MGYVLFNCENVDIFGRPLSSLIYCLKHDFKLFEKRNISFLIALVIVYKDVVCRFDIIPDHLSTRRQDKTIWMPMSSLEDSFHHLSKSEPK